MIETYNKTLKQNLSVTNLDVSEVDITFAAENNQLSKQNNEYSTL